MFVFKLFLYVQMCSKGRDNQCIQQNKQNKHQNKQNNNLLELVNITKNKKESWGGSHFSGPIWGHFAYMT